MFIALQAHICMKCIRLKLGFCVSLLHFPHGCSGGGRGGAAGDFQADHLNYGPE